MKKILIFLSDTHNKHDQLTDDLKSLKVDPKNTIIFHSGDISMAKTKMEILDFFYWYADLPFMHKICTLGNHDFQSDDEIDVAPEFKEKGVQLLIDKLTVIDGLRIYGSPWSPTFFRWNWMANRGDAIAEKWKLIPENLDLCLTHSPAHGILDYVGNYGQRAGCEELYKRLIEVKPKIHSSGHLHSNGNSMIEFNDTLFLNASVVNEHYEYVFKPIVIDYDFDTRTYDIISY